MEQIRVRLIFNVSESLFFFSAYKLSTINSNIVAITVSTWWDIVENVCECESVSIA